MDPLTVRLEDGQIVLSTDDGHTATPTGERTSPLQECVHALVDGLPESDWSYGRLTASTLGTLAESRRIEPRDSEPDIGLAADAPPSGRRRVALGTLASRSDQPLDDVLASRRSQRSFEPMTLADLANVLVPAARVQSWWSAPDGFSATQRPTPSAGGRHPIDLVVIATTVKDLEPGFWHFDPYSCELVEDPAALSRGTAAVIRARAALEGGAEPAAAVFAIAHFERTLSRYPAGSTLVLRDAGALLATMHLCAGAAGLASCIVGTVGALTSSRDSAITDVGALLLGR